MLESLDVIYNSGSISPIVSLEIAGTGIVQYLFNAKFYLGNDGEKELYISETEKATFEPSSFSVSLPSKNSSGFSELDFAIYDPSWEIINYIRSLRNNIAQLAFQGVKFESGLFVIFRQHNPLDYTLEYELKLSLIGVNHDNDQTNFTASYCDMLNCEFPKRRYTVAEFPGLKYVSN